ncbi:PREDICTED: protein PHYTOCHROME KINASE SUBSTRATE 3 [Fragaria vesca subsp. vesca]|uniref:protein PHYTOCHROME KINASE SUBSTRATE 3 n=1 Tax=Fragaria vesca subsp. vesca TaxID=101020 RepID=UPI0002C2F082|nr:PREDICTED: protein PHYTOCHROME KINASE SUBSTRATE 3 [Fragaria vesca subsp. vesca]
MEREANKATTPTTHTRDASFSSYLTRAEGNLVFKSPALNLSKRIDQDGEISVFGAERYFSMMLEDDSPRVLVDYNNTSRAGLQLEKQTKTSRQGTPSACSNASWNNQTDYLPSWRRNQSPNKKKNVNGKKIFSGFVCSGSCSDQKSIHVHEVNVRVARDFKKQSFGMDHHVKKDQPRFKAKEVELLHHYPSFGGSNKEHLAFANFGAKEEKAKQEEEKPRKSLDVFGSEIMKKGEDIVAINLERRLSMLSWDAIPKPQSHSITSGNDEMSNDDNESDASSDLFEIENLTGTGQPLMFTKQASDGLTSMASPTKYGSSEASIDCSVVTANVFSAAVSDYGKKNLVPANQLQHQSLESMWKVRKFTI